MNKEKAIDLIHRLDRGMDKLQATRDCWQSELVYDLCYATILLLQDKIKEGK